MPFLTAILSALKGVKLLAWFLPGGQVAAIVGTLVDIAWTVIKWVANGIAVCLANPAAFSVCLLFAIAGAWGEAKWIGHRVTDLKAEVRTIKAARDAAVTERNEWRQRHADEEKRATAADRARKEAEAKVAAATAAAEQRMRQGTARPVARPQAPTFLGLPGVAPLRW